MHRWAPQDPDLWLRMGVLSFLLTDRDWQRRTGQLEGPLADMGAVNAGLYLDRAVALSLPDDPRPPFWQGWVRHALYQDPGGAQEALSEALRRDARFVYAHAALARLEMAAAEAGYEARAIAHLERAIAALPEAARLHYDLGACLAGAGEPDAARAAFARARACPSLPHGPDALGATLAREFHGDAADMASLVARFYPELG